MARRRKSGRRGLFNKRLTPDEQAAQREAAFDAIRRLYGEALPLWRLCQSGYCRRHQVCIGDVRSCLDRNWPHMAGTADAGASYGHARRPAPAVAGDTHGMAIAAFPAVELRQ